MHPPRAERKLTYLANNKATTCPFPPSNTRLRLETIAKPRTEIIEYYPAKVRITRMAILPLPLRLGCRRAPDSGRQMQPVSTTRHTRPAAFCSFPCSLSLVGSRRGELFRDEIQVSSNVGADFLTRPMSEVAPNQGVYFCLGGMSQNMRDSRGSH